jgi:nucleotide-binding universal stress UspA family protein
MKLDRILLTTDLSDESLRAFAPLASLAKSQQSSVTLLHVVEDTPIVPRGAAFAAPITLPGAEADQQRAEAWLAARADHAFAGLPVDVKVILAPNVGEAIPAYAREHGYDLIAMATHGRTGFRALVMGSVASAVLRHADRPVLVFPRVG